MIDFASELDKLPPGEVKDEILRFVRTTGVREALFAAVELIRDKKAPAAARATLVNSMFKIAGLLDKPTELDDPFGFATMSRGQLQKAVEKLEGDAERLDQEIAERARLISQVDADVDVFA